MKGAHLELSQAVKRVNEQLWRWSVWVEGPQDELDDVQEVIYLLHPTFKDPVRTVTDRTSNFRLNSSGWGQFAITARLLFKDDTERTIEHALRFSDATSKRQRPTVFLSYGIADSEAAQELATMLASKKIKVVDASAEAQPGVPVGNVVMSNIDNSDAVIAVMRSSVSSSVMHEADYAQKRGKPVIWLADADSAGAVANAGGTIDMGRDQDEVVQKLSQLLSNGESFSPDIS